MCVCKYVPGKFMAHLGFSGEAHSRCQRRDRRAETDGTAMRTSRPRRGLVTVRAMERSRNGSWCAEVVEVSVFSGSHDSSSLTKH